MKSRSNREPAGRWIGYGRFNVPALFSWFDYAKVQAIPVPQNPCVAVLAKLARDKAEFFAHGRVFGTTTFITLKNFPG
jgi:hypothetical protein